MSLRRVGMATAVVDDKIFVIGGESHCDYTNSIEYFNEEEDTWFVYS
jgi:hypothetical protein